VSDRIFGLLAVVVALAYIASATQIQTSFLMDPVGPKTFPMIVGGVAAVCALLVIIKPDDEPHWPALRTFGSLALAALTLVAYAYSLKPLGFLLPTAVAASVLSYQIQANKLKAVLTGFGLSIGLFFIFRYALGLGLAPIPRAWMG